MIDFVEIRNSNREVIGIIDTAKSIIWSIPYYGIGDFEIYAPFTAEHAKFLAAGHYVTRQDEKNIGIIEHINITYSPQDGRMIVASGRFGKALLTRRLIYNLNGNSISPVISSGNVEAAARALVNSNIIAAADSARNVSFIELGPLSGLTAVIVDANGNATQKQTSYSNLQEYTDEILQEYAAGAYMGFNRATQKLQYIVYVGEDRSINNAAGNDPIVFSQDYDNLLSTNYDYNEQALKNTALIGGVGEGAARYMEELAGSATGINRREVFIDASDQSKTYESGETTLEYSNDVYSKMLISKARQQLATLVTVETMTGGVDITNSGLEVGVDFYAGDIITIQDNELGKYINARIVKVTEVQDDNGYNIAVEFGE